MSNIGLQNDVTFVEVLSAQSQELLENWKKTSCVSIKRKYDNSLNGYAIVLEGKSLKSQIIYSSATLTQPLLVLHVNLSSGFSLDIRFRECENNQVRHIHLSTVQQDIHVNPLICKLPLAFLKFSSWLNLIIDVPSLVSNFWKGVQVKLIESLSISANCKVSRVFTLSSNLLQNLNGTDVKLPTACRFPIGASFTTHLYNQNTLFSYLASLQMANQQPETRQIRSADICGHSEKPMESMRQIKTWEEPGKHRPHPPRKPSAESQRRRHRIRYTESSAQNGTRELHQEPLMRDPSNEETVYLYLSSPKAAPPCKTVDCDIENWNVGNSDKCPPVANKNPTVVVESNAYEQKSILKATLQEIKADKLQSIKEKMYKAYKYEDVSASFELRMLKSMQKSFANSQPAQELSITETFLDSDDENTLSIAAREGLKSRQDYDYEREMRMASSQFAHLLHDPRQQTTLLSPPVIPRRHVNRVGDDDLEEGSDEGVLDLRYDPVLQCYYDPITFKYYMLKC